MIDKELVIAFLLTVIVVAAISLAFYLDSKDKVCRTEIVQNISCVTTGGLFGGMKCRVETETKYLTTFRPFLKGEKVEICD